MSKQLKSTAWITGNRYLSMSEMENNATLFAQYMRGAGFSDNAIAAILGNMQSESTINPGIWENLKPNRGGYGLVQWTPYTKYSEWAGSDWKDNGDKECARIVWEFDNGVQYGATSGYPMSAQEFKTSTLSPSYLAYVFLNNYERPSNRNQPARKRQAERWYEFITGIPFEPDPEQPDPEEPEIPKEDKFPAWMYFRFGTRFNQWGKRGTH